MAQQLCLDEEVVCSQESIETKAAFWKALSTFGDLVALVNLGVEREAGTSHHSHLLPAREGAWGLQSC